MREWLDFDARYRTDTDGEIPVELLGHPPAIAAQAVSYEPTDPAAFRVMLGELAIDRARYAFVDLGSGKGRAVLLAAAAGFGRAIGVEASPLLHAVACRNVRAWARAGGDARRVELRCGDAAEAELPEQPCVVYLFNPFRERTFARVVSNLRQTLQQRPRDLWVVYYNPQLAYMLQSSLFLARVRVGRGFQQGDYAIWRARAGDAADKR